MGIGLKNQKVMQRVRVWGFRYKCQDKGFWAQALGTQKMEFMVHDLWLKVYGLEYRV
jgi:hypothetical protein